ncbi:amino acid adenylation domain-containing protein [Streptomyces sp. NPDC059063]|uniref:amino acid adenylation domain-containing protein n=1 Tax=unclassified Streptomyces TaxID=2593676 RepID=UPI0036C448F2
MSSPQAASPSASPAAPFAPVAVIGMAVRLPDADTVEELHELLRKGHDGVGPVPAGRLALAGLDPDGRYPQMATLTGIDEFDREFFGITPAEAEAMDPHQRLTLQLAWAAVENAGYGLAELRARRCGLFLSAPRPEYARLVGEDDLLTMLGTASPALAGRIAHTLGFGGPVAGLDTGCSSSLVALHYACRELAHGSVGVAVAGGLSLHIVPLEQREAEAFPEVMAAGGRCRAFDAAAAGTCQGEGGGLLVLKLLDRALADGDTVHAVIRGIGVNHNGGRSTGLSAPGPAAQAEVIGDAWRSAGLDPRRMSVLEGHGSGTRLGDMIELEAAQRVLSAAGAPRHACALGSVKTNLGHLDHAAGIAGLIKAILSVRFRTLYPSLHFEQPNPQLAAHGEPLYVNTAAREWRGPDGATMLAGVSSFSLTGTNVHVVVEEPPRTQPPRAASVVSVAAARPDLATVSAKSPAALARRLSALADLSPKVHAGELPLPDALFVLNSGRADHAYRVAFPVPDADALDDGLRRARDGLAAGTRAATATPPHRVALVIGDPGDAVQGAPSLGDTYPAYQRAWEECGGDAPAAFRHAYATAVLLRSLGLAAGPVLGVGRGRSLARAVRGELPPAEALAEAAATPPADPSGTDGKARAVIARLTGEEPTRFCVLGDAGAAFQGEGHHPWTAHDADAVVRNAAALYEAGAAVDWEAWYEGVPRRRVELPTYPFARTRCWPQVRAAARPAPEADGTAEPAAAPGTTRRDAEREVAAIWESVLKIPGIDSDADYFELGGNSVLGLAVLSRINERFGVRLPLTALYEHNTVAALAAAAHAGAARPVPSDGGIPRAARQEPYLPSHGQESLWFLDQLMPGLPLYNVPVDLHLRGTLDERAIRTALAALERRHQVLRTHYVDVAGEPRIALRPVSEDDLDVVDLTRLADPDERFAEATRRLRARAVEPMDLANGPLFRKLLVRLAPDDHILLLVAHHSVYDGWTPAVLDRDLWELYTAALLGRTPDLPELPASYLDFALWQRDRLSGARRGELLRYWRGQLAGSVPTELPGGKPRPAQPSGRGAHHYFTIPAALMARLRSLSSTARCTLFTTMLTSLKTLLARYSGRDDIVVGTTTAGRGSPDVLELIGYFNNAVPLRTDLGGDPTFLEALARVRETVIGALDHDELPFAMLVEDLKVPRDRSRHPLFQIAYVHQNLPENARDIGPGLEYHPDREEMFAGLPPGIAKWDLLVAVWEYDGRAELPAVLEYSVDLFDEEEIARLADCFLTLLEAVAADPGRRLSGIPVVGGALRRELLAGSAAVGAPRTVVPELFAGVPRDEVGRVAAALRAAGVRPGDTVAGLAGGRDAVVALLAVLSVGAVYAPCELAASYAEQAVALERGGAVLLVAGEGAPAALPWPGEVLALGAGARSRGTGGVAAAEVEPTGPAVVVEPTGPAVVVETAGGRLVLDHRAVACAVSGAAPDVAFAAASAGGSLGGFLADAARCGGAPAEGSASGWTRLGPPAPGTTRYVLDGALEPLPPGVPGELYVGGALVGVGYAERGGDTARDFPPDPFGPEPGARLRRTGERARVASGGGIEVWRAPADGAPRGHDEASGATGGRPANLVEASLMDIWADVLGREVGRHEDFFAIGGHSLLVMRILSEVRRRHGVRLPVSVMFDHRTVRELGARVGGGVAGGGPVPAVVLVQGRGDGPPVFCLARAEAAPLAHHDFVRRLVGRAPVYAVVAGTAADAVAALRGVRPDGPYHLIGFADDAGDAALAEGVARQLAEQGAEVTLHGPLTGADDDVLAALPGAAASDAAAAPEAAPAPAPADGPRAELLPDRAAPDEPTGATTVRPYRLAPGTTALLRRPSDRADVPVAGVLASVAALLARLTGEPEVTVGLRHAGEDDCRAVRVDTGGGIGAAELIDRAETALGAARLLPAQASAPAGGSTSVGGPAWRNPRFSVAVEVGDGVAAAGGLDTPYGRLDALWRVRAGDDGPRGAVLFDADRFRPRTAKRLVERWRTLLDAAARSGDTPLGDLPLMDDAERRTLVHDHNDTARDRDQDATLATLVQDRARQVPDRTAVVLGEQRLSYRDLDTYARRLALRLRERGAGPETVVGVCAERSAELVVALLGVLYAGAAYLPLDPEHPARRLEFMVSDSGARLVVDGPGAVPADSMADVPHLSVSLADLGPTPGDDAPLPAGPHPDNPAYVMYTSGSTGTPKGVVVPHRGVVNRILWGQETDPLDGDDRVLQKTPFSFDVSVPELFSPLAFGATLVLAEPGGHRDPFHIADVIERHAVTDVHFVPSMLREFLAAAGPGALRGVRRLACSGEALPQDLRAAAVAATSARLLNLYGPTEASIEVSAWDCRKDSPCPSVPIGVPIANARLYVLDERMRPCPLGVPGELYLAGPGLARGYVRSPGLTARRFVPSPFGPPGERLYRSGDRCRVVEGGAVEYLGRVDDQVKLRGLRIEPGEIEALLTEHPAVRGAAVTVTEARAGDQRLVAHLVGERGQDTEDELRALLAERLPAHMLPGGYVWRGRLPLTASGKLDRRALATPEDTR